MRCSLYLRRVWFRGSPAAAPGVIESIDRAELVLIGSPEAERRFQAREQRRLQADAQSRRRQEALKLELESAADKSETIAAAVARARRRKSRVRDTD